MAQEFIAKWKLLLGNVRHTVWSGTVVNHLCFRPHVGVAWRHFSDRSSRNSLQSLFTAACDSAPPFRTNLHVITRPEIVVSFAVTSLAHRLHHHFIELCLER